MLEKISPYLPPHTCELGMSKATGHSYRHLLEILEEATRPLI